MSAPPRNGFTLVEMMVALSIFSLAALALLRLGGATLSTSGALREQGLAQIVARNIAVETLTDPQPPPWGEASGQLVNGGRPWVWTRRTQRSPEPRIAQIEIGVAGQGGPGATVVVFRRADRR
jgi:general secretion pathway protein I